MKMNYHRFVDRHHPDDYRQEEVQALKRAICAKENRLILGIPDIGLSNLLRFLVTRTDWGERDVTFAYVDCDALEEGLDKEGVFAEIARQFRDQQSGIELEESVSGYERLKRLVLETSGNLSARLVVVANKTDRMLAAANDAFYRKLKALTDLDKRICYIFAVSSRLADTVDPEDLLFAGRKLVVGPFNQRDLMGAIAEEGKRLGKEFSSAEKKQLALLTGGHAGLLRAISSATLAKELNLLSIETSLIECLLARGDVRSRCKRIWDALDSADQFTLHEVVSGRADSGFPDALAWLQECGLIQQDDGEQRVFSSVFAEYVAAQQLIAPVLEPVTIVGDSYNEHRIIEAGKAFKGSQELHVSRLELRLIACLQRESRIYTKDEIGEYVYGPQWIGEDALIEDIVRQVRKRLGDKRYIKTHPKMGYEFLG
ncbi:MAG: winged helix-turn-helix domain-containing protein [Anaerolineae bacterium]